MGKKTETPEAPDYTGIANQQSQLSQQSWADQLRANRPTQTNQFGSSTWSQDPTTGQWTQSTQLNQPQQDIFNQQQYNQQQLADIGGELTGGYDASQVDLSGAPAMGQVGQFNQQATDLYRQLGQPDLDRAQAARKADLAARGISDLNSGAGANLMAQLGDQTNRFGMEAAQRGITQGNTMFGQQNQLHQQGVSDILNQKQANINQMQGLFGLGQQMGVPQFDNFTAAGSYQTPDLMGAANQGYQANMDETNAGNADKANTMKTVGTIASIAAIAF
jgi:hypothetical protein